MAKWRAPERSLAAVRAAAEAGDLAAQHVLGTCLYYGSRGAARDVAAAVAWQRRAAAGNVALALTSLGGMHERGEGGLAAGDGGSGGVVGDGDGGLAEDLAAAVRLYERAAAQGLELARLQRVGAQLTLQGVKPARPDRARFLQPGFDVVQAVEDPAEELDHVAEACISVSRRTLMQPNALRQAHAAQDDAKTRD